MTSTVETDIVQPQSGTNTNLQLKPKGTGAVTISGQAMPTDGGLFTGRNMVLNSAMNVSQRGTSFTGVAASAYHLDRFQYNLNGTVGASTVTQQADGPNGFKNSLKIDVTTADASLASGDRLTLVYKFEGQDLQRIKKGTADAEKLTLSFWVKATKTGTQIVELFDHDNTRHCAQSYTVSSGDTWEYKTVEYPADATGALDDDNSNSLSIFFGLACGSDYTSGTLATTWAANTNANRFVGQVNNFDSTSNNWQITGVQLECGDSATPFEYESYEESLAKCKRYYTSQGAGVIGYWNGGTNMEIPFQFFPSMRATPTVAVLNATPVISNKSNSSTGTQSGMALVNSSGTANGFYFVQVDNCDTGTSPSAGHIGQFRTDNFMSFAAEL